MKKFSKVERKKVSITIADLFGIEHTDYVIPCQIVKNTRSHLERETRGLIRGILN